MYIIRMLLWISLILVVVLTINKLETLFFNTLKLYYLFSILGINSRFRILVDGKMRWKIMGLTWNNALCFCWGIKQITRWEKLKQPKQLHMQRKKGTNTIKHQLQLARISTNSFRRLLKKQFKHMNKKEKQLLVD